MAKIQILWYNGKYTELGKKLYDKLYKVSRKIKKVTKK